MTATLSKNLTIDLVLHIDYITDGGALLASAESLFTESSAYMVNTVSIDNFFESSVFVRHNEARGMIDPGEESIKFRGVSGGGKWNIVAQLPRGKTIDDVPPTVTLTISYLKETL